MTDEQVKAQIKALRDATKKASRSQETALQFLREAGILALIEEQEEEERQEQKQREAQSSNPQK